LRLVILPAQRPLCGSLGRGGYLVLTGEKTVGWRIGVHLVMLPDKGAGACRGGTFDRASGFCRHCVVRDEFDDDPSGLPKAPKTFGWRLPGAVVFVMPGAGDDRARLV
jgi:hypothetical protein